MHYPLTLTPDDKGTLLVTCPDLPEVVTFGETEAEALAMGQRAVEEALAARLSRFEAIPRSTGSGRHVARVSLQIALKSQLQWALADAGLSRAELARRLDWHRPQVDRLFDPNHATRLDQYEAAFLVAGKAVSVELQPA